MWYFVYTWTILLLPRGIVKRHGNGFDLKIVLESVHAAFTTVATRFVATVRRVKIKCEVAIDPNDSCFDRSRNRVDHVNVLAHYPCRETVFRVVCAFDPFLYRPVKDYFQKILVLRDVTKMEKKCGFCVCVNLLEFHQTHDWSKDFFFVYLHIFL